MQLLDLFCRANISLNSSHLLKPFLMRWASRQGPSRRALGDVIEAAHCTYLAGLKQYIEEGVFPEFGVIIDTSPLHAGVEVIALVMVDHKFKLSMV
jgi:hypothetical protein